MKSEDFLKHREKHTTERYFLCDKKSLDYASEDDRLSDFKETAESIGITPEQVLMVFATKHWRAINTYIKNGCQDTRSEPIIGRIYDLQNYLDLLIALKEEDDVERINRSH